MGNDIFQAIRSGLNEELSTIITIDNVNIVNEYNQSLLHEAITYGKSPLDFSREIKDDGITSILEGPLLI